LQRAISSAELSAWLRDLDAGELVMGLPTGDLAPMLGDVP
jgi:hypothetical protein